MKFDLQKKKVLIEAFSYLDSWPTPSTVLHKNLSSLRIKRTLD